MKKHRFYSIFDKFDPYEVVLAEYSSRAITADVDIDMSIFITPSYCCLHHKRSAPEGDIKVAIHALMIEGLEACVAHKEPIQPAPLSGPTHKTVIKGIDPSKQEVPDALRLFTKDKILHQFFNISDVGKMYEMITYIIDVNRATNGQPVRRVQPVPACLPPPASALPQAASSSGLDTNQYAVPSLAMYGGAPTADEMASAPSAPPED